MEENKDKLVFSSIRSEKKIQETPPKEAVNKAFHDEYIRQTQEIPVQQIKQALQQENGQVRLVTPQAVPQQVAPQQPVQQVPQQVVSQPQPVQQTVQQPVQQAKQQPVQQTKQQPVQQPQQVTPQQAVQSTQTTTKTIEKPKKVVKEKEVKERHRMKKSVKVGLIVFIITFTAIFSTFRIISYFNNPRVITKRSLLNIGEEIKNIVKLSDEPTIIGNNFNIQSTITTNLDSQVFKDEALTDSKMLENLFLINNLNASKTTLSIIHNTKDKKFFYNRQTIKNDKVVVNDKYLIDNSTEYYFVQNFLDNYVNDGNNTYFETIKDDVDAMDNIKYLYKLILESIPDCIDEDYYNVTDTTTYIDNKTESVHKVSIKLDNIKLRKIANKVLAKLKKDKRAFNILNGVIDDFSNYRITSKTKYIGTNDTITVNFYTKGTLNKTKKYEVIKTAPKSTEGFTYEVKSKTITLLKDNKVRYYLKYKLTNTNIKIEVFNKSEKKIGSIVFDNTDSRKHLTIEIEDEVYDTSLDINYKVTDKKSTSYKSNTKAIINIKKDGKNYLSGTANMDTKVNNKVTIEEEVNDVTFSSEITEDKKEELSNLFKTRLKKEIN